MLSIENLNVTAKNGEKILKDFSLTVEPSQVCAIMGPNGCGKSTFANVIAGHPDYDCTGRMDYQGQSLLEMEPHMRAALGIFVAFQSPVSIPGVNNLFFMKTIVNAKRKREGLDSLDASDFLDLVAEKSKMVGLDRSFWDRSLNDDFSGGERKRNDILQMLLLEPKLMILDETDSGLDIDSMKLVSNAVNSLKKKGNSIIVITHYQRLLDYIKPDVVKVMQAGNIKASGKMELVKRLEKEGYNWLSQSS
jgi:Fe-S cluster assembly ATP-binding protein